MNTAIMYAERNIKVRIEQEEAELEGLAMRLC